MTCMTLKSRAAVTIGKKIVNFKTQRVLLLQNNVKYVKKTHNIFNDKSQIEGND